jgi:hypothetical protein
MGANSIAVEIAPEVLSSFAAFSTNPLAGVWVSATTPVPSINAFV